MHGGKKNYQNLQLASLLLVPWGLFFFEAMPSVLVITFSFPLLIFGKIVWVKPWHSRFWPYLLIYAILVISGTWSRDTDQWLILLRVNLPYLVLPLAFFLWPEFLWQKRNQFLQHFIWAGATLSVYIFIKFLFHSAEILNEIEEGGSFLVPVNHVRTSLFLSIAAVFGWHKLGILQIRSKRYIFYSLLILVLIAGLHLLAVRTGLFLFYLGTFLTFVFNRNFHNRAGVAWVCLAGLLFAIGFFLFPTMQAKWLYFMEDIKNYNTNSWWFYSDALRWRTNTAGWEIFRSAPLTGVGIGDVYREMHMWFYQNENVRVWEYPHNLWITFLAGSGLVGCILLNVTLGKIFLQLKKNPIVWSIIFIMYMVSCLFENTLITSLGGISFIIIMLLATGTGVHADVGELRVHN